MANVQSWEEQEMDRARQKWWAEYPSLRGASLEEVAMYWGDPVCLALRATDGTLWEACVYYMGYEGEEPRIRFRQIEEE
jgi:hypothetical protein